MRHSLYIIVLIFGIIEESTATIIERQSTNATDVSENGWVSPPNVRGTSNLLSSCLNTMFLCAWTAYHPNIRPKTSFWKDFSHRVLWLVAAVFAPEVVLFCASEQWWIAKRLQRDVNKYTKAGCDSTPAESEIGNIVKSDLASVPEIVMTDQVLDHFRDENFGQDDVEPWTLEQAFYATCGGIAVKSSSFWHQTSLTFTPAGVVDLAACGLLPVVPEQLVKDKSKADTLAKLFVCVQAGWFLIQSIARLTQHLPLTLLEIHTLAHILCAFCMYCLWIQKPYNVEYPTYLEDQRAIDLAALFALDSGEIKGGEHTYRERKQLTMGDVRRAHTRRPKENIFARMITWIDPPYVEPPAATTLMITHFQLASRAFDRLQNCLNLVSETFNNTSKPPKFYVSPTFGTKLLVPFRNDLFTDTGRISIGRFFTFVAFSAVYGAVHLGAWNSHFPSTVEKWMWRAGGLVMVSTPSFILVSQGLTLGAEAIKAWKRNRNELPKLSAGRGTQALTLFVVALQKGLELILSISWLTSAFLFSVCVYARFFIFAEVFISLRSTAKGTYQTVVWTDFIPHIG